MNRPTRKPSEESGSFAGCLQQQPDRVTVQQKVETARPGYSAATRFGAVWREATGEKLAERESAKLASNVLLHKRFS